MKKNYFFMGYAITIWHKPFIKSTNGYTRKRNYF